MAQALSLIPGFQYKVDAGPFEGDIVTIVDNATFPDDHPHRRKITVAMPSGDHAYILPRLLNSTPVGMEQAAPVRKITRRPIEEVEEAVEEDAPVSQQTVAAPFKLLDTTDPIVDPMDPRLDRFRPSVSKVKRYMAREMPNGMSDIDFLLTFTDDNYRAENEGRPANVMLKGDTQSGKTFLVEVLAVKWAEAMGLPKPMPIFTLSGSSGITDYDLFGQTTSYTDEDGERLVWLPGVLSLAADVGGILYLDEVNAMGERVTSSVHPLADHRHQFVNRNKAVLQGGQFMPETVVGSLDLWIIGTYNEGYRGMGEMNEAFINRFRHLPWGYDPTVEGKLVKSPAIRLLADALRTTRKANKIRTPVGTAALQRLERDVHAFGAEVALWTFSGMFKANEREIVETIIDDRSIEVLLSEEIRQAEAEADREDPED
jgi:MoxR-like ATPase